MERAIVKILHYAKDSDNTWSSTSTELVNTVDMQSNLNIQVKSDAFQMQLYGETTVNFDTYQLDDKFDMFAKTVHEGEDYTDIDTEDTTVFDSTFIYSGVLNQWRYTNGDDGSRQFIVQGANAAERLLKTMLPAGYISQGGTTYTATTIITNLLELTNDKAGGKNLSWDTGNPSLNSAGAAFSTISYAVEYKPVYQMIADLSQDKYTGDGAYYYYIKTDSVGNHLVWKKRNQSVIEGTLTENTDFIKPQIDYGVWDTVNYLIINAGKDPKGNGILTFYYDSGSIGQLGMRSKYFPYDAAESLHKHEQTNNTGFFLEQTRFPSTSASYAYTAAYDGTAITSNDEYLAWFRTTAKAIAKKEGKAYVDKYKYARYKMKAEAVSGTNELTVGAVYLIDCPSVGWTVTSTADNKQKLRLVDIKHNFTEKGWETDYEFEQDWEAIII